MPDPLEDLERYREIAAIRERLAQLQSEKADLEGSLNKLLAAQETKDSSSPASAAPVTNASSPAAKIALFRSLFRGRGDVFPKCWENPRTRRHVWIFFAEPVPASVARRLEAHLVTETMELPIAPIVCAYVPLVKGTNRCVTSLSE